MFYLRFFTFDSGVLLLVLPVQNVSLDFLQSLPCRKTSIRTSAINGQWGLMEINGDK